MVKHVDKRSVKAILEDSIDGFSPNSYQVRAICPRALCGVTPDVFLPSSEDIIILNNLSL